MKDFEPYQSGNVCFGVCLEGYVRGEAYYTFAIYKEDELYTITSDDGTDDDGTELTFTANEIVDTITKLANRFQKEVRESEKEENLDWDCQ